MLLLAANVEQLTRPDVPWPVILGIVIMTTGLIMRGRRHRRGGASARLPDTSSSSQRNRQRVEGELRELLLELERLAREVEAQIEVRHRKLEVSIRTADERIARLEGLLSTSAEPASNRFSTEAARPGRPPATCEFSA